MKLRIEIDCDDAGDDIECLEQVSRAMLTAEHDMGWYVAKAMPLLGAKFALFLNGQRANPIIGYAEFTEE